jgi:exo-beta-1,3-glucanase (GH17 family)
MKALKITKLLNLLTTGAVVGGTMVGGIYIGTQLNSVKDEALIDLSTYNGALQTSFYAVPNPSTLLNSFATDHLISNINDLRIQDINPTTKQFRVATVDKSSYFKPNTYAQCTYNIQEANLD